MGVPFGRQMEPVHVARALQDAHVPRGDDQERAAHRHVAVEPQNITNPTITHADKVMNAISAYVAALKGVTGKKTPKELKDLQEIVTIAGGQCQRTCPRWNKVQRSRRQYLQGCITPPPG